MKAKVKATGEIKNFYPTKQSGYYGYVDNGGKWYYPSELDFNVEELEEVTIDGWVARDDEYIGKSELYLYPMKPFRKKYWFALPKKTVYNAAMRLDVGLFPNLTFENSPMEVTITIKPKKI